jgi:hypothetical protein
VSADIGQPVRQAKPEKGGRTPSGTGDWLGEDASGQICWALPTDQTYTAYQAMMLMTDAHSIGDVVGISCQLTSSVSPPTSGEN